MNDVATVRPPRVRTSIRRLVYWVGPVLLFIAAWQIWDAYESKRIARELTTLFPDGVEQRSTWPPPTNDAGAYYAAANVAAVSAGTVRALDDSSDPHFSSGQVVERYRGALASGNDPLPEETSALTRFLSQYELPLRLVRDATERPYTGGGSNRIVQSAYRFTGMISMRDAVSAETLELVRKGDAEGAAESLISRVQLLRAYDSREGAMAALIKGLQGSDLARDTAILLSRLVASDRSLVRLEQALTEMYDDDEIVRLIDGEVRGTYSTFESIWSRRRVDTGPSDTIRRPLLKHLTADGLETSREAFAASKLPWPERLHAMDRLEDRRSPLLSWFLRRPRRPYLWPVADSLSRITLNVASGTAFTRSASLAVAVERYRRSQGALPTNLDDLRVQNDASVDPFTGKILRYVADEAGYAIYSFGRDFRDDGGRFTGDPTKGQAPDRVPPRDIGVRVSFRPIGLQ